MGLLVSQGPNSTGSEPAQFSGTPGSGNRPSTSSTHVPTLSSNDQVSPSNTHANAIHSNGAQHGQPPQNGSKANAPQARSMWWWAEILSMLLSIVCMGLILGILAKIQNQPTRSWDLNFTPNALIAVCTTVGKMALMIPVVSCIGQMKWSHFIQSPHPLEHLQRFDDASRGPWGSFRLLTFSIGRKSHIVTTWGLAFATVAGLAMEPTAQNVLDQASRETLMTDVRSKIGSATAYTSRAYPVENLFTQLLGFVLYKDLENTYFPSKDLIQFQSSTYDAVVNGATSPQFSCESPASRLVRARLVLEAVKLRMSTQAQTEFDMEHPTPLSTEVLKIDWYWCSQTFTNVSVGGGVQDKVHGDIYTEGLIVPNATIKTADRVTSKDNQTLYNISPMMSDSLTTRIRDVEGPTSDNLNATWVEGDAFKMEQYFDVRWPWLILPLLETVLAGLLLAATMYVTRGKPLLKTSVLAFLLHPLAGWTEDEMRPAQLHHESMKALAKTMSGQLACDGMGSAMFMKTA
ncbi:hypothetical protein PG991_010781 [Apiospora marii]|uniref:Uncharacterized protein n=1 Tax=Apiospora marii TaxID=335849 RepID=A0ABR1RCK7_9PEZI